MEVESLFEGEDFSETLTRAKNMHGAFVFGNAVYTSPVFRLYLAYNLSSPPKISWHFHFPVLGHHLPFPLMLLNLPGSGHLLRFKYLDSLI